MRIIAGERRGHTIDGPRGRELRPTSDMVRESIFNILRDDVEERIVVDLFAGTGALGLEALSRGAARGIFVEKNRSSASLVRRNLATLRYEDRGSVVVSDAYQWANTFEPIDDTPMLVLIDPPYREFEGRNLARMGQLIGRLTAKLTPGSTILVESGTALGPAVLPDHGEWIFRRYGDTHLSIRTMTPGTGGEPAPPAEHEPDRDS